MWAMTPDSTDRSMGPSLYQDGETGMYTTLLFLEHALEHKKHHGHDTDLRHYTPIHRSYHEVG